MLTPVYVYDNDLPQSRIPSTPSLLPIHDLPAASITINYSFMTFNYSFVTMVSRAQVPVRRVVEALADPHRHREQGYFGLLKRWNGM
jgi:hypothetical protein